MASDPAQPLHHLGVVLGNTLSLVSGDDLLKFPKNDYSIVHASLYAGGNVYYGYDDGYDVICMVQAAMLCGSSPM